MMKGSISADRFQSELNRAISLHQQNRLTEAERVYRQLLRIEPEHFDVVHLLGTLLRNTGNVTESLKLLNRAVSMRPQSAAAQLNRANALVARRSYSEAAAGFARAIALKPDYAEAYNGLAVTELELGNPPAARRSAEMALKLRPGYAEAAFSLAMALAAENHLVEARRIYVSLLSHRPAWSAVMLELGRLLRREKEAGQAAELLARAQQIDPARPAIAFELALALRDLEDTLRALVAVERALALDPKLAQAHGLRGDLLREQGRLDEALASYDHALRLAPEAPQALSARGHLLSELGRREEAAASYEAALTYAPHLASALYGLGRLRRLAPGDPLIDTMREAHARAELSAEDRSELCFAMAKAFEETGDFAASFASLQEANACRRALLSYRFEQDQALFDTITAAAPGLMAAGAAVAGVAARATPIFILGMPRSGTTLLEQILSSGPDVQGGGELDFVRHYGQDLATGRAWPSPEALQGFAAHYLAAIAPLSGGRPWVTDKMPLNFRFVPLICAALPQARILHIHRDPRAVCWSNYKHYFGVRGLGFAYSLDDIVRYHRLYADMMKRWDQLCPGRIVHVDYERLSANPAVETRAITDRLGLPWHEAYLTPESNDRVVRTASADQVRKPVYQGSSEAWQVFASFIGTAFDGLAER